MKHVWRVILSEASINWCCAVCLAIFIDHACPAQSISSKTVTNFGESANGVCLSIVLTNNVINVGSTTIEATIRNLSTNVVSLIEFVGKPDFDIFLVTSFGNTFKLTPPTPLSGSRVPVPIVLKPGEIRNWTVSVTIGSEFQPGEYVLKASRRFKSLSEKGKWVASEKCGCETKRTKRLI